MADAPTTQVSTGTQTGWEEEKKRMEAELNSLRGSVQGLSKFKQRAEAWDKMAGEAGDAIKYGPDGMPIGWNVDNAPAQPAYAPVVNPLGDLGVDSGVLNTWLQQNVQSIIQQQGYITQAQADTLATQKAQMAYQAAQGEYSTRRAVDRLLSQPQYKELSDPKSEWTKRTAEILIREGGGRPASDAWASWDEWQFGGPKVLPLAAEIAYAQMVREKATADASQQQAIQNQGAAGISGAFPGTSQQVSPNDAFEKTVASGGDPVDLLKEVVNQANQAAGGKLSF